MILTKIRKRLRRKHEVHPKSWTSYSIRFEKEFGIAPDSFHLTGF